MLEHHHHGKIARLPRNLRHELNQRLADGEPSDSLLAWLNAQPEVQAVLADRFGGNPISPQNLSNWRQGGYKEWCQQQERLEFTRQLAENAEELTADGQTLAEQLTTVLVAELAAATREVLATITDPKERCTRLQALLHTLTRVRQQDQAAARLAIDQERRDRERAQEQDEDEFRAQCAREDAPLIHALRYDRMAKLFAQPDLASQMQACAIADALLQAPPYNIKPSRPPVPPVPPPSRPIKVNQGRSNPVLDTRPKP